MSQVPVIALTGYLGAGKTTVLNHLLQAPGARVGVVVNDFGQINVDAALITGEVDRPASIAGGCICCLPNAGGLDEVLTGLTRPRLRLDAIVIEASGMADPIALARLIHFSDRRRVRPAGLIDVVDATHYFDTVDTGPEPPARYQVASLVLVTKTDRLDPKGRRTALTRIQARIRSRNPRTQILIADHGRIDPRLVFDTRHAADPVDQLPLAALERHAHPHHHADAVTVRATGPVDATRLLALVEDPPEGAYRLKGTVSVATTRGRRGYAVNLVGREIALEAHPAGQPDEGLVAIGLHLDRPAVRARLERALVPAEGPASPAALRRLEEHRRLNS